MEDIGELSELQEDTRKNGFFKYVFNFDDHNKNCILNLFQYAFLAIPMVVIVLKLLNHYSPEEDDSKGSLVITGEILGSLFVILGSIWIINKIIRFIPTYSKEEYKPFNEINFVLPLLIILFTMQTKLGNKINILVNRIIDLIEGKTTLKNEPVNNTHKTTQPIVQAPHHQASQADNLKPHVSGNSGQQLLNNVHNSTTQNTATQPQTQQTNQNFNQYYSGPNNPLVNANSPSQNLQLSEEPMAANESIGMFGGSLF